MQTLPTNRHISTDRYMSEPDLRVYLVYSVSSIRRFRQKGLPYIGEVSGVHYVSIARLEAGNLDPQLSTLLMLCQALNITPNQLIGVAKQPQKGR